MLLFIIWKPLGYSKLERYIKDCSQAIAHSKLVHLEIKDRKDGYDDMPMLTSQIFNSFSQTDLLIVTHKLSLYTELLSLIYCIDFLKKNMPVSAYNNFADRTNKHLEEKNLPAGNEQFEHIKTCASIDEYRRESIHDISLKIKTANDGIETARLIINELNGQKISWLWKYFWTY